MKKILVSVVVIAGFVLYTIFHNNSQSSVSAVTGAVSVPSTTSQRVYKDGTYTGSGADAYYGTVQVKATIQNGKLADVQILQSPSDRDESVQINEAALPVLKQEAIQAQSSQVDIVSGATQTSQAFNKSLQDALSQAK